MDPRLIVHAFSKVGRTSGWHAFPFILVSLILRLRLKKLRVLFAFLQMLDMCWCHLISEVIVTPRYFAVYLHALVHVREGCSCF